MNMNQLKKAAPDLLGATFSTAAPNYDGLLSQLKAINMMPAAWALEELMETNTDLEDQLEETVGVEAERDVALRGIEELEAELGRYKEFFADIVWAFENRPAGGSWPCAEPDDAHLVQCIVEALERDPGEETAESA